MAYGHAERNLALIRQLEAETRDLLSRLGHPDLEQSACLQGISNPDRTATCGIAGSGGAGLLAGLARGVAPVCVT
jgi:hypothetical protein